METTTNRTFSATRQRHFCDTSARCPKSSAAVTNLSPFTSNQRPSRSLLANSVSACCNRFDCLRLIALQLHVQDLGATDHALEIMFAEDEGSARQVGRKLQLP
jgi:hypothetical protein